VVEEKDAGGARQPARGGGEAGIGDDGRHIRLPVACGRR
jgi:hypothetical protein